MSNGNGKATLLDTFKTIVASPVGGWIIAVAAIGILSYWIIKDREIVYHDLAQLRAETLPVIIDTKKIADEARNISAQNNEMLQEMRSWMNIPLENRSDMKKILKEIQQIPKEGEVNNINQ